ncbi:cytochrome P450 2G1-like [Mantella aurantiaca]
MVDLNNVTCILVGVVTFFLVLYYRKYAWRRRNMPPGPFPLPILGNCLQLHSKGVLPSLLKMADKYGPIYTIHFGSRPTVIVTGYQVVKEVFLDLGDNFLARGTLPVFERFFTKSGLSLVNGEIWKQQKQFSLVTLKDFGMGKKILEEPIQLEAQYLVDYFRSFNKQPVYPRTVLSCASSNIIADLLLGKRYEYTDSKWMKILQNIRDSFEIISSQWGQIYDIFPSIMRYLPGPHQRIFDLLQDIKETLKECIKNHQNSLDPANPRDYIDSFLIKMEQEKLDPQSSFNQKNLLATVLDMFLGGAETTSVTLSFGLLCFIKYPEIQDKLHEEIDRIIGRTREPRVEDRNQMPYMNAIIHEVQRISDVFPMGVIRSATMDVTLRGYNLLKGTDIMPLLTTVLHDPSQFETPEKFNVKHFLDEDGKFKKNNGFMAFSAGKRSCIGESIVRMELFIFFTTILQKFILKSTMDTQNLNITPTETGFGNIPPNYNVIFFPRE